MLVHKVEAVWSVVESGVYRVCGGANKCLRGPLGSVGGEIEHCSRRPHFVKRVITLYFCDVMVFIPKRAKEI